MQNLKANYQTNFIAHPLDNLGIIFTKIPKVVTTGIENNIAQIKTAFSENPIPFFENTFIRTNKIPTSKLSTFILDRNDDALKENIKNICKEFTDKVGEYNNE